MDDDYCTKELLLRDNQRSLEMCKKYGCDYLFIDDQYNIDINLFDEPNDGCENMEL